MVFEFQKKRCIWQNILKNISFAMKFVKKLISN
jgi:hypothetical protein